MNKSSTEDLSVAVVVLNWNGIDLLRQFMPQWVAQTREPNIRLVIADNHSTDESVAYLRTNYPDISLIEFSENWGFAQGYNRAIEQLQDDIVVLLNSDAFLSEGWWREPRELFAQTDVAAVQPKLLSYTQPTYFEYAGAAGGYLDALGYPYCRGRIFDSVEEDKGQYDDVVELDWATGAALMIRREVYQSLGGLDPKFFAHQEEIDLCWRLRARAYRILYAPTSVAYHIGGGSLEMNSPRKTYLNFRNNLLMIYKNTPSWSRLLLVLSLRFILDYLSALLFLIQGKSAHSLAVLKARIDFWSMRPSFARVRKDNKTSAKNSISFTPFSIVFSYYIRGKKLFREL